MPTLSLRDAWNASAVPRTSLAHGLRAAAVAGRDAFPFRSLRRLIGSLRASGGIVETGKYPDDTAVPRGQGADLDGEVQGIAYDEHYLYLNTTDSLYKVARRPTSPPTEIPAAQRQEVNLEGYTYVGRWQLSSGAGYLPNMPIVTPLGTHTLPRSPGPGPEPEYGPEHLSAPTMYQGFLLVPAEGVPSNAEDEFPRLSTRTDGPPGRYQWIWVFDRRTLGFVGRFGLDAAESGLKTSLSWISADEESGLLYASSFGDVKGEIVDVAVFRLPSLAALRDVAPSERPAIEVQHHAKPLVCAYVGKIPLLDGDGRHPRIRAVQGGVVTPGGRLYLNFNKSDKDPDDLDKWVLGVLEFDLLSGRATHYLGLGHYDDWGIWLQGMATIDGRLYVLVWDHDYSSVNQYTVVHCASANGIPL